MLLIFPIASDLAEWWIPDSVTAMEMTDISSHKVKYSQLVADCKRMSVAPVHPLLIENSAHCALTSFYPPKYLYNKYVNPSFLF